MTYTKGKELGNYDCGCHIHRDSEGFYLIDWCEKHKAVDDLYEALRSVMEMGTIVDSYERNKAVEALAKAKGK